MSRAVCRTSVVLACVVVLLTSAAGAQDNVLVLEESPAKKSPEPFEGATVEFVDVSLADQLVHFAGPDTIPLRLSVRYRVTKTANVVLNSRLGTEYWHFYNYRTKAASGVHTRERIDMSKIGEATTSVDKAQADPHRGELFAKGLAGIVGHYLFLIDQPSEGRWLGTAGAPSFFARPELTRKLIFTLANLTRFSVDAAAVESTWEPGGLIRVRLAVTDADGDQFPVVNVPAELSADGWTARLATGMTTIQGPTGWLTARLPEGTVPEQVTFRAELSAMTPAGPVVRSVVKTFRKGEGRRTLAEMRPDLTPVRLPVNAKGQVRETRALWVGSQDVLARDDIDAVVARAGEARLNVLVVSILRRAGIAAHSSLLPLTEDVEEGLDPLGYLIERAHAAGLEVHPWFTVTYRRSRFRDRFGGVDMIDADGQVLARGADVHRPRYRDFIVNVMAGVARDYHVDGIHLDYIRSMGQCYCPACRKEFQAKFGCPLEKAEEADWIAWQREAVGDIVRRTAERVRAARPDAVMSCAVFSNLASGAFQGQDPAGWAVGGWMDVIIPMDYKMQTLLVHATEQEFLHLLHDDGKLVTGLCLYQRGGRGASPRPASLVREQIDVIRHMGIHGYCLFAYTYLSDDIIHALKTQVNQEPAVPFFRDRPR